jgi:hypothetical protein
MHNRARLTAILSGVAVALAVGACGSSHTARVMPSARLVSTPGSASKIVLSAVGAHRIGLITATARKAPAPAPAAKSAAKANGRHAKPKPSHAAGGSSTVIIPASAVVYDPSGKTYAFVSVGRLSFTEVPIVIKYVRGNSAYLRSGPRAGASVVSTGAEELYGVQTGVLGQT